MELLLSIYSTFTTLSPRKFVSLSDIRQNQKPTLSSKLASSSKMFQGKNKIALTSNDWWPPHSPEGDFSNHITEANRIMEHLTRADAVKYYPDGFPNNWNDSLQAAFAGAQVEAAQAAATKRMVEKLIKEKDVHTSRNVKKSKRNRLDAYMDAITEEPPATPRLQHVLPAPVPPQQCPLILPSASGNTSPTTPTHKPGRPRVVEKQASPAEKRGSPLRKSWALLDSDNSAGG